MAPPHRTGSLRALVVSLALLGSATGCGLVYRNSFSGDGFVLYSDRGPEFLERTADRVRTFYRGFTELFEVDPDELGRAAICLDGGHDGVIDYGYSPDLLGYYVPFLNLIHVDTQPALTAEPRGLEQVLLHEIAHQFIVHEYPGATRECWLNEGLAGTLEVSLLEEGRAEHPLLNPLLARIAQKALSRNGIEKPLLPELLSLDWDGFHSDETRERNYALSWSIVHFLLEERLPREMPLGKRIEALYHLDRRSIARLEAPWREHVRQFDLVGRLGRLAVSPDPAQRLSSRWAISELAEIGATDTSRAVDFLLPLVDGPDAQKRELAVIAFLDLLARSPHVALFAHDAVERGLATIRALVSDSDTPAGLRTRIIERLARCRVGRNFWAPLLVAALEDRQPSLRAAAAGALAQLGSKPTIVNPSFWEKAPQAQRSREVHEWKLWLERHDGHD